MHSSMSYEEVTKEICFSIFMSLQKKKKKRCCKKKKKKQKKRQKKKKKKKKKKGFICGAFEGASIEVHYSYNLLKAFYAPWFTMLLP